MISQILSFLTRLRLTPNHLTITGLLFSVGVAYYMHLGQFFLAMFLLLASGICDTFDGLLARHTGKTHRFGALLDSAADRYSDCFYYAGLSFYFMQQNHLFYILLCWSALLAAFSISYIRARSEALGYQARCGFWERPERMLILGFGLLIQSPYALIFILGTLPHGTAIRRLISSYWGLNNKGGGREIKLKRRYSWNWILQIAVLFTIMVIFK